MKLTEWIEHWEATGCSENHLMLKIIVCQAPFFGESKLHLFFVISFSVQKDSQAHILSKHSV